MTSFFSPSLGVPLRLDASTYALRAFMRPGFERFPVWAKSDFPAVYKKFGL